MPTIPNEIPLATSPARARAAYQPPPLRAAERTPPTACLASRPLTFAPLLGTGEQRPWRAAGCGGSLRARVGPVVDAPQPAAVHVAVDLRRRERAVPEQLLDRPQVGAALEHVRRERV